MITVDSVPLLTVKSITKFAIRGITSLSFAYISSTTYYRYTCILYVPATSRALFGKIVNASLANETNVLALPRSTVATVLPPPTGSMPDGRV